MIQESSVSNSTAADYLAQLYSHFSLNMEGRLLFPILPTTHSQDFDL